MITKTKYFFNKDIKTKYLLNTSIHSAIPFECSSIIEEYPGLVILITSNIQESLNFIASIKQFIDIEIMHFPDWETLPFDRFSPYEKIVSTRLSILYHLPKIKKGLLIVSIQTLLQKICPYSYLIKESILIKKNSLVMLKDFNIQLKQIGYKKVNDIVSPGHFYFHKFVMDIYPMGQLSPCRIHFLNNCVSKIQYFNIKDKSTFKEIESILIMPKHEFPIHKEGMNIFKENWEKYFNSTVQNQDIYDVICEKQIKSGIEYWQPLFFKNCLSTLFSYVPKMSLIIYQDQLECNSNNFWKEIIRRYNFLKNKTSHFILQPEKIWIKTQELLSILKGYSSIRISNDHNIENFKNIDLGYEKLPNVFLNVNSLKKINKLLYFLKSFSGKIIFSLQAKECLKKLLNFLKPINIHLKYIKNIIEINKKFNYFYMIGALRKGFLDTQNNFLFICNKDLFPIKTVQNNVYNVHKNNIKNNKNNLSELSLSLSLNCPIIHIEHGVGRYLGLTTIKTASIKSEYLIILYANEDKLYVPISCLHLVFPYTIIAKETAPLHKLGGDIWNKEKKKISSILYDHAANLLNIYSKRSSKHGFSFKKNITEYQVFCNDCPFEITLDQQSVMHSVLKDMYKSTPMDRLVCGDVGFGKTEIAMRASFLSFSNYKQVAILVPTTLLAQQHFDNFKKRFSNCAINIDILSRFRNPEEQHLILQQVQNGHINILIGTHRILRKDIKWYNLGLLIIDEEHRFGVVHKEIIKKQYSSIDILTLTATPIPRTLNMAMTGIKDLSIIEKPPAQRLAIKTFIQEYSPTLVRETILREILRGGQVYYIYNKVNNINNIAIKLSTLVPEAKIKIGHGKMKNSDLKKVMSEFYNNQFNVLVCTTIIENGIDIPKANTIIIEKSDHFGLSQLHQLRGRIGRSNRQSYALLLVNNFKNITVDAQKRLEAILSVDNFGGGFSLSNQDLEIRGVGELLGKEQSGHMKSIGFSLYIKLLKNAVDLLKNGKNFSIDKLIEKPLEIELSVSSLIPENYIKNINIRLNFYKKISIAQNQEEIEKIKYELIDRFGSLPKFSKNLIIISKIRLIAQKIGIDRINSNKKIIVIEFNDTNLVNTEYLIKIFKEQPNMWKMENSKQLKYLFYFNDDHLRLQWILKFLQNLKNFSNVS